MATVYLFEQPMMQMMAHWGLTMASIVHLAYDRTVFESSTDMIIQVGSEALMHASSILLA